MGLKIPKENSFIIDDVLDIVMKKAKKKSKKEQSKDKDSSKDEKEIKVEDVQLEQEENESDVAKSNRDTLNRTFSEVEKIVVEILKK